MMKPLAIFSGNANRPLAEAVCQSMEIPLGSAKVGTFSDGETQVEILENVRGRDVYVIQPTCAPVNQNLVELLVMIDALRRASAASVTAVVPYFGYARQDRKSKPRTPISAKLVADLITSAGANRVVSIDLHAGQIQGFFGIPVDNMYALPVFLEHLKSTGRTGDQVVVVSPDAGGVERARTYAKCMNSTMAIIDKRRAAPNVSEVMNIIGEVRGKHAILIDDIIDTAGTITKAAEAVMREGALSVSACATHGVLSGPAVERITESALSEVLITDTIPLAPPRLPADPALAAALGKLSKFRVISIARLVGETIRCIHNSDSVSRLFL